MNNTTDNCTWFLFIAAWWPSSWQTKCGESFTRPDFGKFGYDMPKFCPFCGKKTEKGTDEHSLINKVWKPQYKYKENRNEVG